MSSGSSTTYVEGRSYVGCVLCVDRYVEKRENMCAYTCLSVMVAESNQDA